MAGRLIDIPGLIGRRLRRPQTLNWPSLYVTRGIRKTKDFYC